jgi:glycogen debranching enzyme
MFQLHALAGGEIVQAEAIATPEKLTLTAGEGTVEFIYPDPNELRIRGCGLGLRLLCTNEFGPDWGLVIPAGEDRWRAIISSGKIMLTPLAGSMSVDAPWHPKPGQAHRHHGTLPITVDLGADGEDWELHIVGYESEIDPPDITENYDVAADRVAADFGAWRDACPPAPDRYAEARELAAYIGWSAVVPPAGNFVEPAMLMSKNWMTNAWNWDNYFNAWANTYRDPDFAWGLYMLHIRHQHPCGALGDAINQQKIGWSYTKPPVHGWMLRRMMAISEKIDFDRLEQVYEPLVRWTQWWFRYRDDDNDGICQYHHGNDSGWDDATAFDIGMPNEAPDLNALLVIQMDALADIAERLGKGDDAAQWRQRSADMLEVFLKHSWRDGQFRSMVSGSHAYGDEGDSLLNYIPLVLGHRLPEDIRKQMIDGLTREGRFLTEWGLATEAVDSPEYLQRGYWRGAIWPPPMMMIIDGLADAGETDLAADLAERFCRMVATYGFGENHDALTGVPHYDPAYTWAVSVFQILAAEHLK